MRIRIQEQDRLKPDPQVRRKKLLTTIAICLAFVSTYFFFVKLLFL